MATACSAPAGEQRIELATEVVSTPAEPFNNAFGWRVQLDEAWLSVGTLTLLEDDALGASARSDRAPAPWLDFFVKTAHAHPGHEREESVLAEMLTPAAVDLLALTALGRSEAVTGQARSGRFTFAPVAQGAEAGHLDGSVVRVVGRAQQSEADASTSVRHFIATAHASDLSGSLEISGCPFDGEHLAAGGTIRLEVDVALWFDQVDFEGLPEGSTAAPTPLGEDSRAHSGFLRGLVKAAAYQFLFVKDPP